MNVMISYSHGDYAVVNAMKQSLERKRIKVWIDRHEIDFGQVISDRLKQMISTCDYLIMILSPNSLNSSWVAWELSVMLEREQREGVARAIPILIRGDLIPNGLVGRLFADFRTPESQEKNFSRILAFLLQRSSADSQSLELGQDYFADAAWSDEPSRPLEHRHPPAGIVSVNSPMVGTVFLTPEPGASAFIEIGQAVREGDTLLIIEAMKTMNQITAPRTGVVDKIFFENESSVEFGVPLVWLR